jgi:hypothetical protein
MAGMVRRCEVRSGAFRYGRHGNNQKEGVPMSYKWVDGSRMSGDVEIAAKVCEGLDKQGRLNAKELVEASRDENAPLHDMFEWDDAIAAEKYREEQAKKIIRSIELVIEDKPVNYRAFSSIGPKAYTSTQTALSKDATRRILLNSAKAELQAFKRKYSTLKELSDVFSAIDEVMAA